MNGPSRSFFMRVVALIDCLVEGVPRAKGEIFDLPAAQAQRWIEKGLIQADDAFLPPEDEEEEDDTGEYDDDFERRQ